MIGIIAILGASVVAGLYLANTYHSNEKAREEDRQNQRNKSLERLKNDLGQLENRRSNSCCGSFFTFILIHVFVFSLLFILHITDFFRYKKEWFKLLLDWKYWFNYNNNLFQFNYYGIGGVVLTVVVVILPLLFFLCQQTRNMTRIEREINIVQQNIERWEQEGRTVNALAQGGWVNVVFNFCSCLNVHCTCNIVLLISSTSLAFITVVCFICYVAYTYYTLK